MSKFIFTCPQCKKQFYAQEDWIGESTDCPNCHSVLFITRERNVGSLLNKVSPEKKLLVLGIALTVGTYLLSRGYNFLWHLFYGDENILLLVKWCSFLNIIIFYLGVTLVGVALEQLLAPKYQKINLKVSSDFIAVIALIIWIINLFFGHIEILSYFTFILFGGAIGKNFHLKCIPKYSFSVSNQREFWLTVFCWFISMALLFFKMIQWLHVFTNKN